LTAIGKIVKPQLREIERKIKDVALAQIAIRPVYFAECGGFVECPIYDRYQLGVEHTLDGPAIVIELDSTLVIHPGYQAVVDKFGNLIITK
jgi:N-methylhydantoinase A